MEKKWIRDRRLFATYVIIYLLFAFCFVSSTVLGTEAPEFMSVVVEVEAPIVNGDLAGARQHSQKMAFEKALAEVLSATLTESEKAMRLKAADHYIKSFRVLDERTEGKILKLRYRCEVMVESQQTSSSAISDTPTPMGSQNAEKTKYEIIWASPSTAMSSVEVMKFVESAIGSPPQGLRMMRSGMIMTLPNSEPPESIQAKLSRYLGSKGTVKILPANPLDEAPSIAETPNVLQPPSKEWMEPNPESVPFEDFASPDSPQ